MDKETFNQLATAFWYVWAVFCLVYTLVAWFDVVPRDMGITAAGIACLAMATKEDK